MRSSYDLMNEAVANIGSVCRSNGGGTVTSLLETDIAMRGVIVQSVKLKLNLSTGKERASLDAPFKGTRQADELGLIGSQFDGLQWFIEISAGCAVAVPEAVVEEMV
jgi:hypothetical protein